MLSLPPVGAEHLRTPAAHRRQRWKVRFAMGHLAAHLDPVVQEDRLHLAHHRTFDLEMRVAPMLGVLRPARPFGGDPDASGKIQPAIDHQQLAGGSSC
jgi:hypothetical protein